MWLLQPLCNYVPNNKNGAWSPFPGRFHSFPFKRLTWFLMQTITMMLDLTFSCNGTSCDATYHYAVVLLLTISVPSWLLPPNSPLRFQPSGLDLLSNVLPFSLESRVGSRTPPSRLGIREMGTDMVLLCSGQRMARAAGSAASTDSIHSNARCYNAGC